MTDLTILAAIPISFIAGLYWRNIAAFVTAATGEMAYYVQLAVMVTLDRVRR